MEKEEVVARQQRDKPFSVAKNKLVKLEEAVFSMRSAPRLYDGPAAAQVRELHAAFEISYVYDYVIKLCRTHAEVLLNHVNSNVHGIVQGQARHKKYQRLKLGSGRTYDFSVD
jgi:hypothetical protein